MTFPNEKAFKDHIAAMLSADGHEFIREVNIGTTEGRNPSPAYIDFASLTTGAWFIECKQSLSLSGFCKALGQCLFYREWLEGYAPIILVPASGYGPDSLAKWNMESLCHDHGIGLATEHTILKMLHPLKGRDQNTPEHLREQRRFKHPTPESVAVKGEWNSWLTQHGFKA